MVRRNTKIRAWCAEKFGRAGCRTEIRPIDVDGIRWAFYVRGVPVAVTLTVDACGSLVRDVEERLGRRVAGVMPGGDWLSMRLTAEDRAELATMELEG